MNPQRGPFHALIGWAGAILVSGMIFFLSSLPIVPVPMKFEYQDKFFHFTAYFFLAASYAHAFWKGGRKRRFLLAFLLASLYGITDEFHQYFVPGRDVSVFDWIADSLGGWVGAYVYLQAEDSIIRSRKPIKG